MRVYKIIWITIAILLAFWDIFFFIKMKTIKTLGVIGAALLFIVGMLTTIVFLVISGVILLIMYLRKRK